MKKKPSARSVPVQQSLEDKMLGAVVDFVNEVCWYPDCLDKVDDRTWLTLLSIVPDRLVLQRAKIVSDPDNQRVANK